MQTLQTLLEHAEAERNTPRVLANLPPHLLGPGGHILLSGIPLQDKYDIWRRYTNLGCREVNSRIGEEYATYLFIKG